MKNKVIALTTLMLVTLASVPQAFAGCEFASNCKTDSSGNTYTTEQNLGGGYNTYKNGNLHSQTEQTLGGGYKTDFQSGGSEYNNQNPYDRNNANPSEGRRSDFINRLNNNPEQ